MEKKQVNEKVQIKIKKTKVISTSLIIAGVFLISVFTCFKLYLNIHVDNHLKLEEIVSRNKESLVEYQGIIECGTTWEYKDFINNIIDTDKMVNDTKVIITLDGNIIGINDSYVFDRIEEHTLIMELEYDFKPEKEETQKIKMEKRYNLNVVDTTAPVIIGLSDKAIAIGEPIDLKSGITALDTVDGEVEVVIANEINTKKAGIYKIEVKATDKSGNTATGEFSVTISEIPTTTTTRPTTTTKTTTTKRSSTTYATTTKKTTTAQVNDESTRSGRLYMAKQEAKRVVSLIIRPSMTDEEKAYAIFTYLHNNVEIQTDQSSEAYQTNYGNEAYAALIKKVAACSGFCRAVTLLCDEAGLQSQHVNANLWIHQWNRVLINGEWIVLDAQGGIFGGTTHPLE